ncbi:MAG: zf-HC2 domain-containing protein [Nitrospirota bacterium]
MSPRRSSHPGKPCLQRLARLSAYIERELPPGVRDEIRSHMTRCEDCRVMLRTLRKTIALCRRARATPPPRRVSQRVLAALRRELSSCGPRPGGKRVVRQAHRKRKNR